MGRAREIDRITMFNVLVFWSRAIFNPSPRPLPPTFPVPFSLFKNPLHIRFHIDVALYKYISRSDPVCSRLEKLLFA